MAPLWAGAHRAAAQMPEQVRRALGSDSDAPALGEELFDRILGSTSGTPFSVHTYEEVWSLVRRPRIQLAVPEMLSWLGSLDPSAEAPDPRYPFSLIAGQRRSHNANQILRPPAWRRTDPDGALRARAADLASVGVDPGDWVAVETPTGRIVARAEADESLRPMQAALPHGYGMSYPDGRGGRVINGPRLNLITSATDRDPIAGTPHHKDIPVRLEPATQAEREAAEQAHTRVRETLA